MKEENKMLRNQIAQLRNEKPQSAEQQLERTMGDVQSLQRKVDLRKADNSKK